MTNAETKVLKIINECIELNASFTVSDIKHEAKERKCTLPDKRILSLVNSMSSDYATSIVTKTIGKTAISYDLFHPTSKDPFIYDDSDVVKGILSDKKVKQHVRSKVKSVVVHPLFNKDRRFTITASNVKKAGFKHGDVVYVIEEGGRIIIKRTKRAKKYKPYKLTVDNYNNIRIRKRVFDDYLNVIPTKVDVLAERGCIQLIVES